MGEIKIKGVMKILGKEGDERVVWDADDQAEVMRAATRFNELMQGKKKHNMFLMDDTGKKGKQITEFDPSAGAILAIPAMVGGSEVVGGAVGAMLGGAHPTERVKEVVAVEEHLEGGGPLVNRVMAVEFEDHDPATCDGMDILIDTSGFLRCPASGCRWSFDPEGSCPVHEARAN